MGAESMDEADLLDYQKAAHTSDTLAAMRLFHRCGVKVRANFIVRPEYNEEDFDRLSETVRTLDVDLPSFAVLTPLPGTLLFEQRKHELISDNPDLFDCYHTLFATRLPLPRFYDRLASLLEAAAARDASPGTANPGVFYYSATGGFQRMVAAIRNASRLYRLPEREEDREFTAYKERTAQCTLQPPLIQLR
jgi:methyltransferase